MSKKLHLYDAHDVTKSVLQGVPVVANCGLQKTLTRADIDLAATSKRKTCTACLKEAGRIARHVGEVTLRKPEGWTKHLESQARSGVWSFTITSTSSGTTWGGFPLAG